MSDDAVSEDVKKRIRDVIAAEILAETDAETADQAAIDKISADVLERETARLRGEDAVDRNCLSYWYPRICGVVPTPRTWLVPAPGGLPAMANDTAALTAFWSALFWAAKNIGYPCFLRTGHLSGKHDWKHTCFVPDDAVLRAHVEALIEYSELACIMGLPIDVWAVRELLPTEPVWVAPAYGDMPVCREFRCFVRDGALECIHPYWPEAALRRGFRYKQVEHVHGADGQARLSGYTDIDEMPIDFAEKYATLCDLGDDAEAIGGLAEAAGGRLPGYWSVDVLWTKKGWHVTDCAVGEDSFHWDRCPQLKEQSDD